jgi:carbamoyltransferase
MKGSYLGPSFTNDEIEQTLKKLEANYERLDDAMVCDRVAEHLAEEKVIGIWRKRKSLAGCRGGWSLGHVRWADGVF